MNNNYIYLLQTREFIMLNEPVYKIGQTTRGYERIKEYKGGRLKTMYHCPNIEPVILETILIRKFDEKFIKRTDLGREYYEGDVDDMIKLIYDTIYSLTQKKYDQQNSLNQSYDNPIQHEKTYKLWFKSS